MFPSKLYSTENGIKKVQLVLQKKPLYGYVDIKIKKIMALGSQKLTKLKQKLLHSEGVKWG